MPRFCRVTALVLILVLFCTLSATPILGATTQRSLLLPVTAPPAVSAAAATLYDPVSEEFLFLKNADVRHAMASTTKVMTALVVLERADLAATVVVPREAVGVEGSSIYLFEGEEFSAHRVIKCRRGGTDRGWCGHGGGQGTPSRCSENGRCR